MLATVVGCLKAADRLSKWYADVLQSHPFSVLLITGTLSTIFTGVGIVYGPKISLDSVEGQETRNTAMSNARIAWEHLWGNSDFTSANANSKYSAVAAYTDRNSFTGDGQKAKWLKIATEEHWLQHYNEEYTGSPCRQLNDKSTLLPQLAQVVFKVANLHQLFSLEMVQTMCQFEAELLPVITPFKRVSPYRHMWTVANYAACYSKTNKNCSHVTEADITQMKTAVQYCSVYAGNISSCSYKALNTVRKHIAPVYHVQYEHCASQHRIPKNCSKLERDIIYKLVSTGSLSDWNKPAFVNVYLPLFDMAFYRSFGKGILTNLNARTPPLRHYLALQTAVEKFSKASGKLDIVAMNLGIKFALFNVKILTDSMYSGLAFILLVVMLLAISKSLFYSIMVGLSILFSVGVAFFLYGVVFQIRFFPLLNQMVLVLLIGIGADDTFILSHILNKGRHATDSSDDSVNGEEQAGAFRSAFGHAALAMFVTSATTAASFCSNCFNSLIVIKCFGLFAGITMMVNYVLVVTWLPAAYIVLERYIEPWWNRNVATKITACTNCCQKLNNPGKQLMHFWLPRQIKGFDFVIVPIFCLVMAVSSVLAFITPGLKLPAQNPYSLLRRSHPFEWYDNHAYQLFPAIQHRYQTPVNFSLFWGFKPTTDSGQFNWVDKGHLERDHTFKLDSRTLWELRHICQQFTLMYTIGHRFNCWTDRFWRWSAKQHCDKLNMDRCCNITDTQFHWGHLSECVANATKEMSRKPSDTDHPVFLTNGSSRAVLVGYVMNIGTDHTFNFTYSREKAMFADMNDRVDILVGRRRSPTLRGYIFTPRVGFIARKYDNERAIMEGTPVAVLFSMTFALVVLVISTRNLALSLFAIMSILGVITTTLATTVLIDWRVRGGESTIIVLIVGLSFDYTLHYAVAYKLLRKQQEMGDVDRIRLMFESISLPVLHLALTTLVAGLAMLPAETQFMHRIGVFMCLITVYGWLYASLFFTALLALFEKIKRLFALHSDDYWLQQFLVRSTPDTYGMDREILAVDNVVNQEILAVGN